jgi:oligopeptide transport system ATP-binding protein
MPLTTSATPVLSVNQLSVQFSIVAKDAWPWTPPKILTAVDKVSFTVQAGQTLGIVGESGCGKSTLARALLNLVPIKGGEIIWQGKDLCQGDEASWFNVRKDIQMIFQDPLDSLNPRMTIAQIIAEPLTIHAPQLGHDAIHQKVLAMMKKVGLNEQMVNRYPHEFSGGQCQRIGIARALIAEPKLIICDEPVSALDVSIQAQIINLLKQLQAEMGLALIFIAHDLAVVKHIADDVLVMYLGREMELAKKTDLFNTPKHPYTQALLSAIPIPDPKLEKAKKIQLLNGDLPSPLNPPKGCAFHTRCPQAFERCHTERPVLKAKQTISKNHRVACHLDH